MSLPIKGRPTLSPLWSGLARATVGIQRRLDDDARRGGLDNKNAGGHPSPALEEVAGGLTTTDAPPEP